MKKNYNILKINDVKKTYSDPYYRMEKSIETLFLEYIEDECLKNNIDVFSFIIKCNIKKITNIKLTKKENLDFLKYTSIFNKDILIAKKFAEIYIWFKYTNKELNKKYLKILHNTYKNKDFFKNLNKEKTKEEKRKIKNISNLENYIYKCYSKNIEYIFKHRMYCWS